MAVLCPKFLSEIWRLARCFPVLPRPSAVRSRQSTRIGTGCPKAPPALHAERKSRLRHAPIGP